MKAPTIPRSDWSAHPRYPSQALLLGSHANFRRISRHLVEHTARGDALRGLERLFRRWISAMRSHEAYEEYKLYPYLGRRWGVDFAEATAGHEALHERYDEVIAAFLAADGDVGGAPEVTGALERHDRALTCHLDHEEELVIPLLLSLTPQEFADYAESRPG